MPVSTIRSGIQHGAAPNRARTGRATLRVVARWMATFVGFPLGGLTASLVLGPVDGPVPAVAGGLITGAILGAIQSWGLGAVGPATIRWVVATAGGGAVGLGVGAAAVGYGASTGALALQGAVTGLAVGMAQAVVLHRRSRLALAWPAYLAAVWAVGWTITAAAGIQVSDQFTVFGSSGAIVAAALTTVLPIVLRRQGARS